jgi:hypothetical protein
LGGLRLVALLGRFGLSTVIFEGTRIRHRGFKPVEELGGRIHLVVTPAIGEDGHLVQIFGKVTASDFRANVKGEEYYFDGLMLVGRRTLAVNAGRSATHGSF